jgi:nucleoside-diphosphate-sugar epimerase
MASYLVTGGAGFIGGAVVRALLARGDEVRVLDNLSTGSAANLVGLGEHLSFTVGDLTDSATVTGLLDGVAAVIHLGAVPSVPRSVAQPLISDYTNTHGTLNVFLTARDAGIRRVVYASSSSVYGRSAHLPLHEDLPTQPLSPYAVTKVTNELYGAVCSELYGMDCIGLRFFNVFGPRQDPHSAYAAVIPAFIQAMRTGASPILHGDGLQARDFTYVENVVTAILSVCDIPESLAGVYNVACGQRTNLLELVGTLNKILGTELPPAFGPPRPGDILHSWADISKAAVAFGYRAEISFEEGLRRTVRWFEQGENSE